MIAVHFTGIDNIVQAFQNKGLPVFAVCSGKQILHKYTGESLDEAAEELEAFLRMLNQGSNAIYTLRIYEDVPAKGIKENTPADYSLNFRLNLPNMLPIPGQEQRVGMMGEILSEVRAMRERLAAIEDDQDDEDDEPDQQPQSVGGIVNNMLAGMLQNPEVQQMIATKLISGINGMFNAGQPAAIAGITTDESQALIGQAIDRLINATNGGAEVVGAKLAKLADMAETNPGQYSMIISML